MSFYFSVPFLGFYSCLKPHSNLILRPKNCPYIGYCPSTGYCPYIRINTVYQNITFNRDILLVQCLKGATNLPIELSNKSKENVLFQEKWIQENGFESAIPFFFNILTLFRRFEYFRYPRPHIITFYLLI